MAKRSPTLTQPHVDGNTVTFLRSDLAVLLEREQNQTSVEVPAISDALLLCTGINLTPMRNTTPEDLTSPNASLPALMPLEELGTGVQADVK